MRQNGLKSWAVAAVALAAATATLANPALVERRLSEQYPATKITSVRDTPVKGIYEVVMGRNIAYTDETGRFMIFGHLYDMKEQVDLTAQRQEEINRIDPSVLTLTDAIKVVKGNGSRVLYVFSDPNCPYCKRLEAELAKLDDVTIYTFLYPVLGKDSEQKSRTIWCAKDRAKAWSDFMEGGKLPAAPSAECSDPLQRNIRLGRELGINGTPTIILGNGSIVTGLVPVAELQRRLADSTPQRVSAAKGGRP
ncbi:MAG: DsbC family protein [Tepidimonas ignava]|jgi:thiol:disulfide interchange protein DsbC|uniref:DsbC family protein n=1 Tax=Tepidimonas ignava TaxID=114249 RepID=UPI00391C0459